MNKLLKAIILDVGGVLYHPDASPRRKWEENKRISERELIDIVFNNPVTKLAKLGKATPDEIWKEVQKRLTLTDSELAQLKIDMWVGNWDVDLLELAKQLKGRYKFATMSDAWPDARENIKEYVNYNVFDVILFSAEEGILKPDPRFFELAAQKLNLMPKNACLSTIAWKI